MLSIPCPICGPRSESEFSCGGESHISRPGPPEAVDDRVWADYMFYRNNARGISYERWCHSLGCGQWFNIARDAISHRIRAVYPMTGKKPEDGK